MDYDIFKGLGRRRKFDFHIFICFFLLWVLDHFLGFFITAVYLAVEWILIKFCTAVEISPF